MARSLQITCDQCGKQKQESNHWWYVTLVDYRGELYRVCLLAPSRAVPEEERDNCALAQADLCGEECVLKFVAAKMREMK
jgi:hypothetical protein